MNKLSIFSVVAIAIFALLFTFNVAESESPFSGKEKNYPTLKPGDMIDEMSVTTGIEDAFPLWAVCSPTKVNDHSIRANCGELSVYKDLAIGHTLGVMDLVDPSIGWEELVWEMSVDGHPIDLEAFGVYDFVHPDLAPSPSPIREVFRVVRVWNVVLANPTPGMHRIQGQAQSRDGAVTYTWVVDFTVGPSEEPALTHSPRQSDVRFQIRQFRIYR
jgi:hypothetical protein